MSRPPSQQPADDGAQLIYEEYDLGAGYLATIFHPENDDAWIQSDLTMAIRD